MIPLIRRNLTPGSKPRTVSWRAVRTPPSFIVWITRWSLLLVSVAVASGCFTARDTTNEPLDAEKIAGLQPSVTRAAEVVELLGAPTEVVQLARRSAYRYDFINSKRSGLFLIVANFVNEDTRSDRLWAFFDEAQVLSHFGLTLQGDASEYAMPWEPIHGEE